MSFRILLTSVLITPDLCGISQGQAFLFMEGIMFNIPTVDLEATGKNIEKLRKEAGYTVKDLQTIFGFGTPQAIYKWQHGAALPTVDNLVLLSAIFKVSIDEILIVEECGEVTLSASA